MGIVGLFDYKYVFKKYMFKDGIEDIFSFILFCSFIKVVVKGYEVRKIVKRR